ETTPTNIERPGASPRSSADQTPTFRNSIPVENAAQRCMDIVLTPNNTAAVRLMKAENLVVDHEGYIIFYVF
uniref:Uncharacterized protein n=1 Tax=Romanomermis culicivorax TaxID=13658 RepID=A0A915KSI9_ROMCU